MLVPLVSSQGSLSVTVSTDKAQYVPGENVRISGKVLDSQNNPVAGAGVSIQVGDPAVHVQLVFSDNSGSYADMFILPASTATGQYTAYASASKAGFASAQQQAQFTVLGQPAATTMPQSSTQPSSPPSKCFIATATYGSEIAPEVALLRNFRDAEVLQTLAGTGFMQAFNSFYYSFSPQVALFMASHGEVRSAMKVILYPLIGILYVSSRIFQLLSFNGELAVTVSGIFAALGIGAVYFGPAWILAGRFAKAGVNSRWPGRKRLILTSCAISTLALALAEASRSAVFLEAITVTTVLCFLFLGSFSARSLFTLAWGRAQSMVEPLQTRSL
jgi:hypothetical protein